MEVIEELRNFQACLEAIEASQWRGANLEDVIEEEEVVEEEQAELREEGVEEVLVRAIMGVISKPRMKVPLYESNMNVNELMDLINTKDKYFEYENVPNQKKGKFLYDKDERTYITLVGWSTRGEEE